jgi:hypothetical protein
MQLIKTRRTRELFARIRVQINTPVLAARVEQVQVGSVNLGRAFRLWLVMNDGTVCTKSRNGLKRESHKVRLLSENSEHAWIARGELAN